MERRHLDLATGGGGAPTASAFEDDLALADDETFDATGLTLFVATGVRMEVARIVEHDAGDTLYARGEPVLCETADGIAHGEVVVPSRRVLLRAPLPRILRRASQGDLATLAQLRAREQAVAVVARKAAHEARLPVKVVRAEAAQGGARFLVFFASETRFSFRDWLRGIGRSTRERVELRQIGLRDAARAIGGVGPCGLQLCCNTFLSDFTPVSIKMAKSQGLPLNPQRVSGMCGRLLCCLVYEEAHYRASRQQVPHPGEAVGTPEGSGHVREVDVLEMQAVVELDAGGARTIPLSAIVRRSVE